jgi:DNA-binding MarR family transcriptional regulator
MNESTESVRKSSLGFLVKSLASRLDKKMNAELKQYDLNLKQFGTLMMLFEMEGMTQNEIGKSIEMPGYSITRILDELEKKELTYRICPANNRRTHNVYLTGKGKKLMSLLPPIVFNVNEDILAPLDQIERMQLIKLLSRLVFNDLESE